MRTDFYYDSLGGGRIHACRWTPDGEIKGIVQIVHGIAEYAERYEDFATYLNSRGLLVVAEDHMGHGQSIALGSIQGYFHGGWFCGVEDTYRLLKDTMAEFPGVPYVLFGHSMGSFMARTILARHPDSGISGCIICGTAWQPKALLTAAVPMAKLACMGGGDKKPSPALQTLMFGSYNQRVERKRTPYDWLSRDTRIVDAYEADPACGFTATAGLYRDMLLGISYVQEPKTLAAMKKQTPILFTAGSEDPVGAYGKGVEEAFKAFLSVGMEKVKLKLYPLCRHEILNEINRQQVYEDILSWITDCIRDIPVPEAEE